MSERHPITAFVVEMAARRAGSHPKHDSVLYALEFVAEAADLLGRRALAVEIRNLVQRLEIS